MLREARCGVAAIAAGEFHTCVLTASGGTQCWGRNYEASSAMARLQADRIFGADGVAMGGMMDKPVHALASAWSFYVNVEGLDPGVGRIEAHGGEALARPHLFPPFRGVLGERPWSAATRAIPWPSA